jgi:hypothetical protein
LTARHKQSIPLREFIEEYLWADLKIGPYIRARWRKHQKIEKRK